MTVKGPNHPPNPILSKGDKEDIIEVPGVIGVPDCEAVKGGNVWKKAQWKSFKNIKKLVKHLGHIKGLKKKHRKAALLHRNMREFLRDGWRIIK